MLTIWLYGRTTVTWHVQNPLVDFGRLTWQWKSVICSAGVTPRLSLFGDPLLRKGCFGYAKVIRKDEIFISYPRWFNQIKWFSRGFIWEINMLFSCQLSTTVGTLGPGLHPLERVYRVREGKTTYQGNHDKPIINLNWLASSFGHHELVGVFGHVLFFHWLCSAKYMSTFFWG